MSSTTRCLTALCLAFSLSFLSVLPGVYAGANTEVANRTIERVSPVPLPVPLTARACSRPVQTVQLRTHSIHAPYIDEDLQNRYVRALDARVGKGSRDRPGAGGGTLVRTRTSCVVVRSVAREGALTCVRQNTNKHIRLTRAAPSQMVRFAGVGPRVDAWLIRGRVGVVLGMAVVPSAADVDQLCHRDRVQGAPWRFWRRLPALHACVGFWRVDAPVRRRHGDLAHIRTRPTRARLWQQRSVPHRDPPRARPLTQPLDQFEGLGLFIDTYAWICS